MKNTKTLRYIYTYGIIRSLIVLIIGSVLYVISYNNPEDSSITDDNTKYEEMRKWQKHFFMYLSSALIVFDGIIMFFSSIIYLLRFYKLS